MTQLETVSAGAGADTVVNENNRALAPAGLYGIRPAGTAGLTLGYYGGAFNGVDVPDGSVTLTASATNYVVAHRTTGAVTASTNTTNWLNVATYLQLYQLVAGALTFTIATTSDKRQAYGAGGSGGGGTTAWGDIADVPAPIEDFASLTDPGDDRLLFWDDSVGTYTHLTLGTNLSITGTTLNAASGGGGSAAWGSITGTLDDQTDLKAVLDAKQPRAPAVQAVTSSATVTPTFSNDLVKVTAQAVGLTLANPTGTAVDGLGMVIRVKDNGTARSITYGSQYRAIGVTLPNTTVVGKTTYLAMIWNAEDSVWDVLAVGQQA